MTAYKRILIGSTLILLFILPLCLITPTNYIIQNNYPLTSSKPLNAETDYTDYVITESGIYSNDHFYGGLTILAEGITVLFYNCIFTGSSLSIGGSTIVSFINCSVDYNIIAFLDGAKVTFQDCTIYSYHFGNYFFGWDNPSNRIHLIHSNLILKDPQGAWFWLEGFGYVPTIHYFAFKGTTILTIEHYSTVQSEYQWLEMGYNSIGLISDHSTVTIRDLFRVWWNATMRVEDSTINAGLIYLFVGTSNNRMDPIMCNASLYLTNSVVNAPIIDAEINSSVTLENSSVETRVAPLIVTGSDPILIKNNEIIGSPSNYWIKEWNMDAGSSYKNIQYIIVGEYNANITIDSSQVYGVIAVDHSRINVFNSEITDTADAKGQGTLYIENCTLWGKGIAAIDRYGPLGGGVGDYWARDYFSGFPLISVVNCRIHGTIQHFGIAILVLQNSVYDKLGVWPVPGAFTHVGYIFVEMLSETELEVKGWVSLDFGIHIEELIGANVTVNGIIAEKTGPLHFVLDPEAMNLPGVANIVATGWTAHRTASLEFTYTIVDDDPNPPNIDIQYEGERTLQAPGSWCVKTTDESGSTMDIAIDGTPVNTWNYAGEYSFSADPINVPPANWTLYAPIGTAAQVIGEENRHSNVVELQDVSLAPGDLLQMKQSTQPQTSGTIEFWLQRAAGWQGSGTFRTVLGGDNGRTGGGIVLKDDTVLIDPSIPSAIVPQIVDFKLMDIVQIFGGNPEVTDPSILSEAIPGTPITAQITVQGGIGPIIDPETNMPYPPDHPYPITFTFQDNQSNVINVSTYSTLLPGIETTISLPVTIPSDFSLGPGIATVSIATGLPSEDGTTLDWKSIPLTFTNLYSRVIPPTSATPAPILTPAKWMDNTWYHIRIDFDCTTDKMNVWVNGVNRGEFDFAVPADSIDSIVFETNGADTGTYYLDAIDFSWSAGYYLDRNMELIYEVPALLGSHTIEVIATDLDTDRPNDQLSSSLTNEVIIGGSSIVILQKLEQLNVTIMQLENSAFDKNPTQQKNALSNKIQEIIEAVLSEEYEAAYEAILRDLKPKLTGLKTDENEIPWGNGTFKNPWIIDITAQELFRDLCNLLLYEIHLLIG